MNVVDWLDRLQASLKQPTADPDFLRNLRNPSGIAMDDSEDDDPDADEESTDQEDVEKVRDTLPDVAVPIGLLANLSLDKDKDKGKGRGRGGSATADGSDDNVVSMGFFVLPRMFMMVITRRVWLIKNTSCLVICIAQCILGFS
jgi:hypothetical protein